LPKNGRPVLAVWRRNKKAIAGAPA